MALHVLGGNMSTELHFKYEWSRNKYKNKVGMKTSNKNTLHGEKGEQEDYVTSTVFVAHVE